MVPAFSLVTTNILQRQQFRIADTLNRNRGERTSPSIPGSTDVLLETRPILAHSPACGTQSNGSLEILKNNEKCGGHSFVQVS